MNEQPGIQLPEDPSYPKPRAKSRLLIDRLRTLSRARAVAWVAVFAVIGSALLLITNASPSNVTNSANFSAEGELKRYTIEGLDKTDHGEHESSREEFYLNTTAGDHLKLNLPEDAQKQLKGGSKVRINGNKMGETVTVPQDYEAAVQVIAAPAPGTDLTATGTTTAPASTVRKVAVILFNFSDDTSQPTTVDAARQEVFTDPTYSVNAFYKRSSYNLLGLSGQTNVDGDIFGYYTINAAKAGNCDYNSWGILADQAAKAAGADLSAYNHIIYSFPSTNCGFGGIAETPGSHVWLNGNMSSTTASHELGHNLGLYHANGFPCKDTNGFTVSLSDNCSSLEYYDTFDTMGSGFNMDDFNGEYKRRLNWLVSSNTQTVTTSGDYTLSTLESSGPDVKVIRVPRFMGVNGQMYLELEYRQRNGEGVLVHQASDTGYNSFLIDATDETGSFWQFVDAPLAIGRTLTDTTNNITITPISTTPTSVKVHITVAATTAAKGKGGKRTVTTTTAPPDNAQYISNTAPLAVKPDGQVFSASITMKNTGTTTWLASDYQLAAIVIPTNKWGPTRLNLTNDVAPGATATFTGTFSSPGALSFDTPQSFSWRMVKNSTNGWFGGALTRAITVSNVLTAPAAPTSLQTTGVSSSSVSLSWGSSATSGVHAGYRVYRVGSGGTAYQAGYTTYATSFTDTGLSPSSAYTYYVVAIDTNGLESPQSVAVKATTSR